MLKHAHLITGGFPLGSSAGHDMDFVRITLLSQLYEAGYQSTTGNNFANIADYLEDTDLLLTYVAGPYPDADQCRHIERWLNAGGKWFALHGTSGGKATRVGDGRRRQMVRLPHHDLLGAYFLNHPPIRKFKVRLDLEHHPILQGLPKVFEVADELYLIEPVKSATALMTTELSKDPSPSGFGFVYDQDTSLQADGISRVLATERIVGAGSVIYVALGHCHAPATNSQPFVDESVKEDGKTPKTFRGVWENDVFKRLISNAMSWGLS